MTRGASMLAITNTARLRHPAYQLLRVRIDAGPVLLKQASLEQSK